ncbi:MAG: phosphate ABC transporter permease PstA [Phycisphaerae bacterium]
MALTSRKLTDRLFTLMGVSSILLLAAFLLVLLTPIAIGGIGAFIFRGTVEHRRMQLELFEAGDKDKLEAEMAVAAEARRPVYEMIAAFEKQIESQGFLASRKYAEPLKAVKDELQLLLGPAPDQERPVMARDRFGQTRWDRAQVVLHHLLYDQQYDYSNPNEMGKPVDVPRVNDFKGTPLEPLFAYVEQNLDKMLLPRVTFYWGFLTQTSYDSHYFGGVWAELLGTFYLTVGAIIFAVPMGVVSAIYLVEYAPATSTLVQLIRTCISTLAGVPSIVFGLFGLAFFINTVGVSQSKSVLAGSLTLSILILPLVIRASEEAIRAVPHTYKEASLSLGAGKWRTIVRVILPAALPGILTGIVISMGRAAGETAPIIYTAAVSVGLPLSLSETLTQPTPALPWNIYNLCTEHQRVDEIRHVQYGMVFTLVMLVLLLNSAAIYARAKISKRLRG